MAERDKSPYLVPDIVFSVFELFNGFILDI
jgi:hypothetical protein